LIKTGAALVLASEASGVFVLRAMWTYLGVSIIAAGLA
jgi:hypothetical protein